MRAPSGRGVVIAIVAGLLASVATPAFAEPTPRDAREIAEMARRSYNLGRWLEAIDGFERAYQMTGDAALLFNLAQAHRQLDHIPEALRFYRAYLRERPNGPDRAVAQEQIAELERRHPPAARPPAGPIESVNAPPAPPPPPVMAPAPPPPPPAEPPAGAVAPPATETVPPPPAPVAPTPAPATTAVTTMPPVSPEPPLPRWVPWAGAGLTVALAATAAAVGLSSNRRFNELESSCGQTSTGCSGADIDAVKSRTRNANILWAAAGALAVVTGVGVYVNTREAGLSGLVRF
jgi:tetratricopeptide (TPR) repeat protein